MLFFGISVAAGVVALLAVQKLDIEGVNPPAPKRQRPIRKADTTSTASVGLPAGAVFLRQQ